MRHSVILIFSTFLFITIGCGRQTVTNRLSAIDSLIIKEHYDSAYNLMATLQESQMTSEDNLAHYQLLKYQTSYLANKPLPPDSLLNQAIAYYQKNSNEENLADCYYYKGSKLFRSKSYHEAVQYYKKAESLIIYSENSYLQFKIFEAISMLNNILGNYHLALQYAQKALYSSKSGKRNDWTAYSYFRIGEAYYNLGKEDSALLYFDKTLPLINFVRDEDRPYFLSNLSLVYIDHNPHKAKELLQESLSYKDVTAALEQLAIIYYEEGNKEEAYHLWTKALTINDLTPKDNIIHNMLEYDVEQGRTDKVCERVNEIIAIKDSIIDKLKNDSIKDLQTRFDHEVAINVANGQLIRWQWYFGLAIIVGLVLIGLWLRKRHKLKTMLDKRQIEIQNLILQVEDKKDEVVKYENQIAKLKTEQQNGCRTQEEQESKIKELTRQKEEAQSNILMLTQKMQNWTGAEVDKLRQGALLMDEMKGNKCVKNWLDEKLESLIIYYCAIHTDFAKKIYIDHQNLSAKQCLYLMLTHMKKTNDEMCSIMGIASASLRSYKFQIKQKEKKKK